jgi:hypothetical protein
VSAAQVQLAGMDGFAFLHLSDQTEIVIIQALALKVTELMDQRDESLANRIANAVGKMLGGK